MIYAVIGIILGVLIGLNVTYTIPIGFIKYTAVTIVGILDSLLGAIRAEITKDEKYDTILFLTGLVFNILIALGITLLGEQLGLDLYLAVTVAFVFRIFANIGAVRRAVIQQINKRRKR